MKDGDQSSVYLDNNFKPPDRCEDNYYEFYSKYQTQGGKGLPPPLENQPFLTDRSYVEEDEHLINPLSNATNQHTTSHQQQIQQLQQQIQQQQAQLQQQQALHNMQLQQQQYMQHPQQMHSPHHTSHISHHHPQQHMQHAQHPQSQHPQQHMHLQQQQQPHHHNPQYQQMHAHPHHPQQQQPQQQMHQPFQQMHAQPHMRTLQERSYSVPDARNPPLRSTSNPSYSMRSQFEAVQEDDDNMTIWTPHPRGMVVGLNEFADDDGMHSKQGRLPHGGMPHHRTPPLPQSRDPSNYYNEDFDNVAYRTANQLLKEDNVGIGGWSIWND